MADPPHAAVFNALLVSRGRTASLDQVAATSRQSPATVRRHLAALQEVGAVEAVRLGDAAGAPSTYRAIADPLMTDAEWAELPPEVRRKSFGATLEGIEKQVWTAHGRGGFDAPDAHVSRVPADLDGQGYDDMVALMAETLDRAQAIQAQVVERRAAGTAEGEDVRTDVVLMHFHVPFDDDATSYVPDPTELRDGVCELSDDLADEVALDDADWDAVAARAEALATLARRAAASSPGT